MKINIVCVGSLKEKYWTSAVNEYVKRLSKFHVVEIVEVEETKMPKNYSEADIAKVIVQEGIKLEKYLKGFIVVLDICGEMFSSEQLSDRIKKISNVSYAITFVIGGSWGLGNNIKSKANLSLSFSKMTFPHQLMRVVLLEQLYRATCIANNIPYHK